MVDNIVWPLYLDADRSRGDGRRVPLDLAVSDPSVEEISVAARQIGYSTDIDPTASHPREHQSRGRVIVREADDASKNDLVQAIAAYVKVIREDGD